MAKKRRRKTRTRSTWTKFSLTPTLEPPGSYIPAGQRIQAAAKRLSELQNMLSETTNVSFACAFRARKDNPDDIEPVFNQADLGFLNAISNETTNLASETLHHCRAALDYCANAAFFRDTGKQDSRVYFPLAESEEQWQIDLKDGRKQLRNFSEPHLELFREAQPFLGNDWALTLKKLSNTDKHRTPVEAVASIEVTVAGPADTPDPLGDPDYVGFSRMALHLAILLKGTGLPADDGHSRALDTIADALIGTTNVVNAFLYLDDLPQIHLSIAGSRDLLLQHTLEVPDGHGGWRTVSSLAQLR